MDMVTLISILLTLSAAFAYLNFRFVGLPTTIGVMVMSLVFSMGALALERLGLVDAYSFAENLLSRIDFNETLMDGMLSFLLFAGALHVSTKDLVKIKWTIAALATFGVIISTFVVGSLTFALLGFLGIEISYIYCLLFGALISPTDPIAVMSTLKNAGVSKSLETKIAGESLFNDGVGVVVFIVLLGVANQPEQMSVTHILEIFALEAVGGKDGVRHRHVRRARLSGNGLYR